VEPPIGERLAAAEAGAVALVENWASAGSEGRWDDIPTFYTEDAVWVEQGELRYDSRAAIEAGVAQAAASGMSISTEVENIVATALSADASAVRADVHILFGDPAHGGFEFDGVLTAVAVQIDGEWLFLEGHLSQPNRRNAEAVRERIEQRRQEFEQLTPAERRERFRQRRLERQAASASNP
jgi:ketosteroid isomerase-like protein